MKKQVLLLSMMQQKEAQFPGVFDGMEEFTQLQKSVFITLMQKAVLCIISSVLLLVVCIFA